MKKMTIKILMKFKKKTEFNTLLDNKTFKKFLKHKVKYYIKDKELPVDFINSLEIKESERYYTEKSNNKDNNINYDYFYENSNNTNDNDDNTVKKLKNFKFNTNYEKLENDNIKKAKEIEKLKEKLNNQKKLIIEKKEIINDLQNINNSLKKEVKILKNKNFYEEKIKKYENSNKNLINNINDNYDDCLNNKNRIISNSKYNNITEDNYDEDINLNYKELIKRKNKLIQIRNQINEEFTRLSIKKENYLYRNNLEQKLNKVNNSLKEIRGHLNNMK